MKLVPVQIPIDQLDTAWPVLEPFIAQVASDAPRVCSVKGMREDAESGNVQLWAAYEPEAKRVLAVVGTQLGFDETGDKVATVLFGTGDNREEWEPLIEDLAAWAKQEGCAIFKGAFRPGYIRSLRKYGWRQTHVLLERAL